MNAMVDNQAPVALQCGPYVKVKVFVEGGEGVALRRTRVVCGGGVEALWWIIEIAKLSNSKLQP